MTLFKTKQPDFPRDPLLSRVWSYRDDLNLNSRTVDTHVTRLRRKLQKAVGTEAAVIVAVAKIGYRYLGRSEEHTSELQSQSNLVCRLLLEKKKKKNKNKKNKVKKKLTIQAKTYSY